MLRLCRPWRMLLSWTAVEDIRAWGGTIRLLTRCQPVLGWGAPRVCRRWRPCPPTTRRGLEVCAEDEWVASHPESRPAGPAAQRYPCGATGSALGHAGGTAPPRALSQVPEGGAVAGS